MIGCYQAISLKFPPSLYMTVSSRENLSDGML